MTDWTALVYELEDAKSAMIAAKKAIRSEEERKARRAARERIAERTQDLEIQFAKRLARANAEGLSQALIRREVLRTQDWGTWVKWRDLAEIEPERITIRNLKAEQALAASPFRWAADYSTLTVLKYGDTTLDEPVVYDMSTNQINPIHRMFWPDSQDEDAEREARKVAGGVTPWLKFVDAEIRSQIDAGNVADPAENR